MIAFYLCWPLVFIESTAYCPPCKNTADRIQTKNEKESLHNLKYFFAFARDVKN